MFDSVIVSLVSGTGRDPKVTHSTVVHRTVSSLCYSRVVVPSRHATRRARYYAELGHRYDVASLGPVAIDAAGLGAAEPDCAGCQHGPVESADRRDAADSGDNSRQMP